MERLRELVPKALQVIKNHLNSKETFNTEEAALFLGLSTHKVRELARKGNILLSKKGTGGDFLRSN